MTTGMTIMVRIDNMQMERTRSSAVPWWAAFGAPLVGVPLLVGLLALGSHDNAADAAVPVEDSAFTAEQVDAAPAQITAPEAVGVTISGLTIPDALSRL
jgi:hypothetical protein